MQARIRWMGVLALAGAGLVAASCSNEESAAGGCVPGESQPCAGPGYCEGYQVCMADRSGFGPCDCGSSGGCLSAADCPGEEVCDPSTSQCTGGLSW